MVISLLLWVPISESEARVILSQHQRFREQRDAGIVEHLDAAGTVPAFSVNFGKVPSSESDLILQSSPGLGQSIIEEGERRNLQPRRVSGFAVFNFAPDPASAYAATTVGPETTVQDPVSNFLKSTDPAVKEEYLQPRSHGFKSERN